MNVPNVSRRQVVVRNSVSKISSTRNVITTPQPITQLTTTLPKHVEHFTHSSARHPLGDTGAEGCLYPSSMTNDLHSVSDAGGVHMTFPNNQVIVSEGIGYLPLNPALPFTMPVHLFDDASVSTPIVSIGAFCNHDCVATFTKTTAAIVHKPTGILVAEATKLPTDRLWHMTFPMQSLVHCTSTVVRNENDADFVAFAHASFGSPPPRALARALRAGWLRTYPRLTLKMFSANVPVVMATAKGHLDLVRRGLRSTKSDPLLPLVDDAYDEDPEYVPASPLEPPAPSVCAVQVAAVRAENHSDLTGRFPVASFKGTEYFLISVYKGYVHFEPMRDRSAASYALAFDRTVAFFAQHGEKPSFQRLDNETSAAARAVFDKHDIVVQYVPPGNHRSLRAERAIRDAKNHLISVLATTHPTFPLRGFDELAAQTELTLAHLRPWADNRSLSSYEGLFKSTYDFDAHPIAPCGTSVLIHERAADRESWAPHGSPGFYLGPALEHYRCWRVLIADTHSIRISDTLAWFPAPLRMPGSSPLELIHAALCDLQKALASAVVDQPTHRALATLESSLTETITATAALFAPAPAPVATTPPARGVVSHSVPSEGAFPSARLLSEGAASHAAPQPVGAVRPLRTTTEGATPSPEHSPVRTTYTSVAADALTRSQQHYHAAVGRTYIDPKDLHTFRITDVVVDNTAVAHKNGRRTPIFQMYDCKLHNAVPYDTDDFEYQGCADLLSTFVLDGEDQQSAPSVSAAPSRSTNRWRSSRSLRANQVLNQTADGRPLTHRLAKAGPDSDKWQIADDEEACRLIDSGTMQAIQPYDQPLDRRKDTTYFNPQVREKPSKQPGQDHERRTRGTAGGDRILYPGDVSNYTANLETVKILLHGTISDRKKDGTTVFVTADIKDFYLNTPLDRPEYVKIPVTFFSKDVLDKYSLHEFIHGTHILFEIKQCMYGLKQAGHLSGNALVAHLEPHGFYEDLFVPKLFHHRTRQIHFCLVVDDFGIKAKTLEDAEFFFSVLREKYTIKTDILGQHFLGLTLTWNYDEHWVELSIPDYIAAALARFRPGLTLKGRSTPARYIPPEYGQRHQSATFDASASRPDMKQHVMEVTGTFLYYARAVDYLMLPAIQDISTQQAHPTERTLENIDDLLRYAASHPNQRIRFNACDMILHIVSDASYLSRANSGSVAGGVHYCGNLGDTDTPNGAFFCVSVLIDAVVSSAMEAEYAALFINGQHGAFHRTVLTALGYQQPATPLQCDNKCAVGIVTNTLKPKKSKSITMRYHWIRDRARLGEFDVYWRAGDTNIADYFTKSLSVKRHSRLAPLIVKGNYNPLNPSLPPKAHRRRLLTSNVLSPAPV